MRIVSYEGDRQPNVLDDHDNGPGHDADDDADIRISGCETGYVDEYFGGRMRRPPDRHSLDEADASLSGPDVDSIQPDHIGNMARQDRLRHLLCSMVYDYSYCAASILRRDPDDASSVNAEDCNHIDHGHGCHICDLFR